MLDPIYCNLVKDPVCVCGHNMSSQDDQLLPVYVKPIRVRKNPIKETESLTQACPFNM